jgi:hypothetical protein
VAFLKDVWIKDMLARRYLIVREDGVVLRAKKASPEGVVDYAKGYSVVTQQTHKATGRVYFNVQWRGYRKAVLVNRVVALRYLPNPLNLPQVNHIDGNKQHNFLRHLDGSMQLEWCTAADNEKHAHGTGLKSGRGSANSNAKLTADQVVAIRASTEHPAAIATAYGVSRSTIVNILSGRTWKHL